MSTTNFIIDTDNSESLSRAVYPLLELLKCFLIPIKTSDPGTAITIFSERFIAYIPDHFVNLDNIDFTRFINGSKANHLISVYDYLLSLWKKFQDYGLIGSNYHPDFNVIEIEIRRCIDDLEALI